MDENITGTPEERLEMPWRFDAGGKRYSGPRGVEEKDEFEARTKKDIALEAENEKRWAGWNESRNLPEGRELTVLETAAIKEAADQESLDQEEGVPVIEPGTAKKEEFRAGDRTDEEIAQSIYGRNKR